MKSEMAEPQAPTPTMLSLRNPLTLIVATTPVTSTSSKTGSKTLLGIGKNGTLPWPRIKSDMSFFARVSTRLPAGAEVPKKNAMMNAIVMGRKTYYSLPKTLRPLKDRINVVITRDSTGSVRDEVARDVARQREKDAEKDADEGGRGMMTKRDAFVSHGLDDALATLAQRSATSSSDSNSKECSVGNVFVIGGGEIYASSLRLSVGLRILMTRVKKRVSSGQDDKEEEFDCDTFFPLSDDDLQDTAKWREASAAEVSQWVGEEVSPDWADDGDVSVKVVGYERLS